MTDSLPLGAVVVPIEPGRDPEDTVLAYETRAETRGVKVLNDGWHVLPRQIIGSFRKSE